VDGDLDALKFIAYYVKNEQVLAVATLQRDPAAAAAAELLGQGRIPHVSLLRNAAKDGNDTYLLLQQALNQ